MLLNYSAGPKSGDSATDDLHRARREKARINTRFVFEVAPGASVELDGPRTVRGGEELRAGVDLSLADLQMLVARGVVFHTYPDEIHLRQCSPGARYVVAGGGSIACPRGIIPSGGELLPSDVSKESMAQFVASGKVLDLKAQPPPPAAA